MLAEGKTFCLAKKKKKTSPVRTVLEQRQLGWGPDVALEGVWGVFFYFSGVQCIQPDSYLPTPLHFPISYSYFLLELSTNAYL